MVFLVFYFINAIEYNINQELLSTGSIVGLVSGFLAGFILAVVLSFAYFFGADKIFTGALAALLFRPTGNTKKAIKRGRHPGEKNEIRVDWFLSARLGPRKPRNVNHYSKEFIDTIFKQHHFAAVIAILLSMIFLLTVGFFCDNRIFQLPSAASITVFFAILIAVAGSVSLFLGNWSIPAVVLIYLFLNFLYQENIIDPRNKAYGLDYSNENQRPAYQRDSILKMVTPDAIDADKKYLLPCSIHGSKSNRKTHLFCLSSTQVVAAREVRPLLLMFCKSSIL